MRHLKEYGVEGWLHLDHGSSVEVVYRCLDAGFDSVMIDASEKPFDENVKITAKVVKLASHYNANVEAELGYIAKLGQAQGAEYTQPDEANDLWKQPESMHWLLLLVQHMGFIKRPRSYNWSCFPGSTMRLMPH